VAFVFMVLMAIVDVNRAVAVNTPTPVFSLLDGQVGHH